MLHSEITQEIIGAAMAVLNELKPGLDEKLYENALVLELIGHMDTLPTNSESFRSSIADISSASWSRI